jgi:outer membrane protein assembly factor BamB
MFATPLFAQEAKTLWTQKFAKDVEWFKTTDLGFVLLATDDFLRALDPETGQTLWNRDDLKKITEANVSEIEGTPLLLVSENSGSLSAKTKLHALDVTTGTAIWQTEKLKGVTVDVQPVYAKNFIIMITTPQNGAKSKLDMSALNMFTGDVVWEADFEDKVDLHEADASGRFIKKFDLHGHQEPLIDGDTFYLTYAGLHKFDLNTGKQLWKVPYDVTEGNILRGNAQALVDGDVIYTSAKGQVRAIDKNTGAVKWTSKKFSGAIAELQTAGGVLLGRTGGTFEDWTKKEYSVKKPLGVVAFDRSNGTLAWQYDDAKDSITNMVVLPGQNAVLIADKENLIGLDVSGKGQVKEAFKVKLEFKNKIGAGAVAGAALRVGLGGLGALGGGGGGEDVPVAISIREGGIAVVRGKQHILAFDPASKQIPWSVKYEAPGVSGWQKIAMMSVTAFSYTTATAQAASTYRGTSENTWANNQRSAAIKNYSTFASKRFTATSSTNRYVYVLTEVQAGKEKGAGIVGVDMNSGKSDRQILFKDKEPDYKVDEWTGRVFNVKDKKELTAYSLQ